jgi:hypothetical protein
LPRDGIDLGKIRRMSGGTIMKKILGVLVLAFIGILGMETGAMALEQVQTQINMFKDVSSKGETYGISFALSDDALKNVNTVVVDGPRGARVRLNNTLDLNDILLSAVNLSLEEFNRLFPEGNYKIDLTPRTLGGLKVHMTHNFPSTPAVTYPLDGSVNVPANPVITWAPITGIIGLQLQLTDNAGFVLSMNLPINATSYIVPTNLLKASTGYDLSLEAKVTDFGGNGLNTTMIISFTTAAQ